MTSQQATTETKTRAATGEPEDARRSILPDALAAIVALVGVLDATYLTVEHLSGRNVRCVVTSGCDQVLMSSYAKLGGNFPLAALGALAYFAVFSLATLSAFGYTGARKLLFALVVLMFGMTLWLLYLQAFVIEAFCFYCLISAATTTTLLVIVLTRWLLSRR